MTSCKATCDSVQGHIWHVRLYMTLLKLYMTSCEAIMMVSFNCQLDTTYSHLGIESCGDCHECLSLLMWEDPAGIW